MYSIQCSNITKSFEGTKVIDNVSLNIEENKIYGLLGRNGAGKTTLMKILSGQLFPNSGTVNIFNENYTIDMNLSDKLCFIRDSLMFPKTMKQKDIFLSASEAYPNWDNNFYKELIEIFEVDLNKSYKNLSKGMQTITGLIIGLSSRTPIVIFDEPYSGIDAFFREKFYDILLKDYCKNPRTIILSTHLIDEMSKILENIIIIHKGKITINSDVETLINKGLSVSGAAKKVDALTENKNCIFEETIGTIKNVILFDDITNNEKAEMTSNGLNLGAVSLQKLFVNLDGKELGEKINEGFK